MEQIPNVYQQLKSCNETQESNSNLAQTVWSALTEMFGRQMLDSFGSVPPRLWVEAIGKMNEAEIRRGLENIAKDGKRFPPNLPEFREACLRTERQTDTRTPLQIAGPGQVSKLCAKAMARQEAGIPLWNGKFMQPLYIPAIDRKGIKTFASLKKEMGSLPEEVQRYCRELWKWCSEHKALCEDWQRDFVEGMK